jgi:hypothetical protein
LQKAIEEHIAQAGNTSADVYQLVAKIVGVCADEASRWVKRRDDAIRFPDVLAEVAAAIRANVSRCEPQVAPQNVRTRKIVFTCFCRDEDEAYDVAEDLYNIDNPDCYFYTSEFELAVPRITIVLPTADEDEHAADCLGLDEYEYEE